MATFGKGRTLMLGSYVSAAAQSAPTPEAEKFYASLLGWAGVTLPIRVTGAAIEVRYLDSAGGALLFFFNHRKENATSTVWFSRPEGSYTAFNLASNRREAMEQVPGGLQLGVELPPGAVRVVRIARR
jgi:hypothetical protein